MEIKYIKIISVIIICIGINTRCQIEPKFTQSITFELKESNSTDSPDKKSTDQAKINETIGIIEKRLNYYGYVNKIEKDSGGSQYKLWLLDKANLYMIKKLISTTGKLEIWETWLPTKENSPTALDSVSRYVMKPHSNLPIFIVHKNDTAKAKSMLMNFAANKQWPQGIRYLWGDKAPSKTSNMGNMFELYMIQAKPPFQTPVITNTHIEKTLCWDYNNGTWAIEVLLNSTGNTRFTKVTRENIGKVLAIVIDDRVYSAPVVNTEISGGRLEITGNFTKRQAEEFAAMLRYEPLPLHVKIK